MSASDTIPPRPATRPFTGLPDHPAIRSLQARDQWCCWDFVWKAERRKWDKPPIDSNTGVFGSSTDPSRWSSYARAAHAAARSGFAGVGFALAPDDATTGIDLDECRNKDTGELDRWAAEIIAFAETYAEVSPSGTGIRLFAAGKIEATFKFDPAHVEVYVGGRYLTVTGDHLTGTPAEIRPAPRTIEALRGRVNAIREEAERKKATSVGRSASLPHKSAASASGSSFWRAVNDAALAGLGRWVPTLFGSAARFHASTGAYRVTSRTLGRDLEEDLSITPGGIVDFGVADMGDPQDGKRTPIDLVREHGAAASAKEAAFWLCDQLGVAAVDFGWSERKVAEAKAERPASDQNPQSQSDKPAGSLVLWYGDVEPEPPPYLVTKMLPQAQTAILAGQWSTGKTFVAIDLALAVMLGFDFAGHKVERQGAVIWLAAEGMNEVDARVKAAALHRTGEDRKGLLPFCRQAHGVPNLTGDDAYESLLAIVRDAEAGLVERFGAQPLALIVIDTMNSAAQFQDQSDGAEAQRVMMLGRRLLAAEPPVSAQTEVQVRD